MCLWKRKSNKPILEQVIDNVASYHTKNAAKEQKKALTKAKLSEKTFQKTYKKIIKLILKASKKSYTKVDILYTALFYCHQIEFGGLFDVIIDSDIFEKIIAKLKEDGFDIATFDLFNNRSVLRISWKDKV